MICVKRIVHCKHHDVTGILNCMIIVMTALYMASHNLVIVIFQIFVDLLIVVAISVLMDYEVILSSFYCGVTTSWPMCTLQGLRH